MKERPMLFSAPMVRALLADSKTQTRRALQVQPAGQASGAQLSRNKAMTQPVFVAMWDAPAADGSTCCICPYGVPGDRLWVRETHRDARQAAAGRVLYRADNDVACGWTPSIFMPRALSRILLELTEVRVERLQDISEADALAEGIVAQRGGGWGLPAGEHFHMTDPRISYWSLWDSINGAGAVDRNAWVWAVSFQRISE